MMTQAYGEHEQTIRIYTAYGFELPPADALNQALFEIRYSELDTVWLAAADMCIDLAAQSEPPETDADDYLLEADCILSRIIETPQQPSADSELVVRARLRQAQLPMWRGAFRGDMLVPDYTRLLEAAEQAIRDIDVPSPEATTAVAGFVPVLLGARAIAWGDYRRTDYWHARTTLLREQAGGDTAFFAGQVGCDYLRPPLTLAAQPLSSTDEAHALVEACFEEYADRANAIADGAAATDAPLDASLQLKSHLVTTRLQSARLNGISY